MQQYKVHIKGKGEQFWEKCTPFLHLCVLVAIEKGAFGSPSTTVANFTFNCSEVDLWCNG